MGNAISTSWCPPLYFYPPLRSRTIYEHKEIKHLRTRSILLYFVHCFIKQDSNCSGYFTEQKTSAISQRILTSIYRNDATSQRSGCCKEPCHKTDVVWWSCFSLLLLLLLPHSKMFVLQVQEEDFGNGLGAMEEIAQGWRAPWKSWMQEWS